MNEYNIQIAGFKYNVSDLKELMDKINLISSDCTLQLLNADAVGGYEHVLHSTIHAIKAFKRKQNIANDLGIEICVRASAQRQISKALNIVGIKEGKMNICTVAVNCREDVMERIEDILNFRDDSILKPNEKSLKKIYNITDKEIEICEGIEKVMIERTTLLILET